MHPDQSTPDSHRYQSSDSVSGDPHAPESSQSTDADLDTADDAAPAATQVDDGARVAEAGHAYVGRMMDDDLKSSPRVEDRDEAVDEDPTTPEDD